ncbi:MAG: GNAT family protein [Coprothermobacterota bacterium]|nr:GNAT family protein [Coprothermobacterota bacterium]
MSVSSELPWDIPLLEIFGDLPPLQTERLLLRRMGVGDAEDLFSYASDPEVTRYVVWETHCSLADSLAFLQYTEEQYRKKEVSSWGMVLRESGRLIGTVGFVDWLPPHARAEIGFALGRRWWGRGLMSEAVREVLRFGFERMQLNRIQARCYLANHASARVMEKVGMTFEGIIREQLYEKGAFRDLKLYSILRREFFPGDESTILS